ncbi:MAG: FtsW/RodA/SpoVE family cell cycle protein [Clostridia bacterium]|nr:FtsW/RodA/SpoVE family cell cycle protein [Clostridia bacterium]
MKSLFDALWDYIKKCDLGLLFIALLLSGIGLVAIHSASLAMSGGSRFIMIQGLAIAIGIFAYFFVSAVDLEKFGDFWLWAYVFNLLFQLSLIVLGTEGDTGNRSWIRLEDLGIPIPLGIQPAEIGKLIYIFTFSRHIYILKDKLDSLIALGQLTAHTMVLVGVIYIISGDLGMCLAYLGIFVFMLFASGLSMKIFLPLCAAGAAALVPIWMFFLKGYQKVRILVLFDPSVNPDIAFNGLRSMMTVGAGQLRGQGYLNGLMTQHNKLPSKHTDFIFSTICEEWGFIGAMVVLLILTFLVWKIFFDAGKADNRFGYLMCIGIGTMFMVQILINVGMCLGIMPVIGLTLPFISYGGTSVMTMYAALGMVCGLQMRKRPDRLK